MSFKVPEQHMSNIHAITNHAEVQAHFSKNKRQCTASKTHNRTVSNIATRQT
jgi:hypothetical protein